MASMNKFFFKNFFSNNYIQQIFNTALWDTDVKAMYNDQMQTEKTH